MEDVKDIESLIKHFKSEKNKHLKKAKECQRAIDNINAEFENRAKRELAIDIVKTLGALKSPQPTFYCAKELSIQRVAKCEEQCPLCKAAINVGIMKI